MKQREVHGWVACVGGGTPTRMRSNAVGGGGNSYFMLGVGGCNYDASTISTCELIDKKLIFSTPDLLSLRNDNFYYIKS